MRKDGAAKNNIIISAIIFLAAAAVFFPSISSAPDIVSDDRAYIGEFARLDFTLDNILFYFKHPILYLHSPLVMFSFMADKLIWGKNYVLGIHIFNVILHAVSAVLFFNLLNMLHFYRKGKTSLRIPQTVSAAISLLWALHPQRAESVAWACERKDVLITILFLGAAICFIKSFRKHKFDIAGTILLAASFLCKPMLITFPALAAVFIFCETNGRNYWKKLKFILPSFAVCVLYIIINSTQMGKSASQNHLNNPAMLLEALANVGRYFAKTFFPHNLCTWYSPVQPLTDALYLLIPASMLLLLKTKYKNFALYCLLPAAVMFGLAISPVSGIVPIGAASFADRYSCVPSLFLAAGTAFLITSIMEKINYFSKIFHIAFASVIVFFCIETSLNCRLYRNENAFLENALAVPYPHLSMLFSYGHQLLIEKRYTEAEQLAENMQAPPNASQAAIRSVSTYKQTLKALCMIYRGNVEKGLPELDKVIFSKDSAHLKDYTMKFALDTLSIAAKLHLQYRNPRHAAHIFGMLSDFYGEYDPSERDFYLGVRAMIRREYAEAEMFFLRALQVRPDNERISANLKAARARLGKL